MARSVRPWVGKSDDEAVPPRVRLRIFDRFDGRCTICGRKIAAGESWTCEHVVALINGGKNEEANLGVTCSWCLPTKNASDVAEKSSVYEKRAKHIGAKRSTYRWPSRPMSRNPKMPTPSVTPGEQAAVSVYSAVDGAFDHFTDFSDGDIECLRQAEERLRQLIDHLCAKRAA